MKGLRFLFIGKNEEILQTLKRVIENNEGWVAEISSKEVFGYKYIEELNPDILLLSTGFP